MAMQLEICANSAASCRQAELGGATRVELCASNNKEYDLLFDAQGNFVSGNVDNQDDDDNIPAHIKAKIVNYINQNYPGAIIKDIERKSNGRYEAEIVYNNREYDLLFNAQGNFISASLDDKK